MSCDLVLDDGFVLADETTEYEIMFRIKYLNKKNTMQIAQSEKFRFLLQLTDTVESKISAFSSHSWIKSLSRFNDCMCMI